MSIKQDWMERQLESIGQGLAVVLFGKDKVKKVFKRFEDQNQDTTDQKMEEMLLNVLINQSFKDGEFLKAEKTLFSFIEKNQTLYAFTTALSFYNRLLDLPDDKLELNGLSKEKINQSIEKLKEIYEV